MTKLFKIEPVAILSTVLAVLNAVQLLAISVSPAVHTIILVVTVVLTTILTRMKVSPVASS